MHKCGFRGAHEGRHGQLDCVEDLHRAEAAWDLQKCGHMGDGWVNVAHKHGSGEADRVRDKHGPRQSAGQGFHTSTYVRFSLSPRQTLLVPGCAPPWPSAPSQHCDAPPHPPSPLHAGP